MKNRIIKLLVVICLLCVVALTIASCKGVKMTISFVVDGETYATIDTSGNEMVTIPQSPTKDGYTFDGWYWDNGTWQRPFTANSLLNEPLTANMSVYAKFTEIHTHSLTLQPANEATCTQQGNNAYYTCTCGKLFADEQGNQEISAIPTTEIIEHTPTEWITDSQPTCTANGSKHTECSVCHTTLQTETIQANGHTPETEWKTDNTATCTVNGSRHLECAICHATLQTETIPSSGHTPKTEWKIDCNATCTVNGSKHLECSVCHATLQTETIPSTGHTYSTDWTSDERGHWHVATCEHTSETTTIESHTYNVNYVCELCKYQDTSLHDTEIATEIFDVDGETLYAKVPNTQTTFSFINAIQVADGAIFMVATDITASVIIRTKTVSLEVGDNTYYILVENGKDMQLYTIVLHRIAVYIVTFDTNGGTACDSQQVEEDSLATEPTTCKTGYTFAGWDYDFEQAITANITITASWTVNQYTITYDVNGGVLAETEYTAMYDSAYTLAVPTREGHTFQGWYIGETNITDVNGQPFAVWRYTEDRIATAKWIANNYNLVLNNTDINAGMVTGEGVKVYGDEVTIVATIPTMEYSWLGWYNGNELFTMEFSYTFNMPAYDLLLTAHYKYRDELSSFKFEVTKTACIITGVLNKAVTQITIPDYVTSIADRAFFYCESLTSVTIGNGVTTIGEGAFTGCKLTSVTLGAGVISIGEDAFGASGKIQNVYYNGDVAAWCNISFASTSSTPLYCGANLYIDNKLVRELVIHNTVTKINNFAFYKCMTITSIAIPDSVVSIGEDAFNSCVAVTTVIMGINVTRIDDYAFTNCRNIKNVYYKGSAEMWSNINISELQNNYLVNAIIHYFSESEPELNSEGTAYDDNYWHYVDDVPTIWKKQ